ncbi:MAG: hypothetical protein HY059_07485 [Proteobacteria bacterium]|nr:hypothetical protein [Pseudomonadota bacterium]
MTSATLHEILRSRGWRQGCVLPAALAASIRWHAGSAVAIPENWVAIAVSQDCDILSPNPEAEPIIEVVAGSVIAKQTPEYLGARNPRRLDLSITNAAGEASFVRLEMRLKGVIDRTALTQTDVLQSGVAADDLRTLVLWLTKRYERPAYPDEFNRRLKGTIGKLRKVLKKAKHGQPLAILVSFVDGQREAELAPDEPYQIMVVVELEGDLAREDADWLGFEADVYDPIIDALSAVEGIELLDAQLLTEFELSHGAKRQMTRLDFDDLSLDELSSGGIVQLD